MSLVQGTGSFSLQEHFYSLAKAEKRLPPCLTLQIWDNDHFTPDDFIGKGKFKDMKGEGTKS